MVGQTKWAAGLGTAVVALGLCAGANAQTAERNGNAITFSGQVLMRIRTGVAGYTAEQRAEAVRERLVPILSLGNLTGEDIQVRQTRPYQDASIYVRDRLLLTVDKGLAQANGNNEPGQLARAWAERLRGILPGLSTSDESPFRTQPQSNASGNRESVSPVSDENGEKVSPQAKPAKSDSKIPFRVLMKLDPRLT